MTITRKPTDGTTPEMVLGNLAATTVLTVWDAATKIGHRARLGTLREWLVARLVPPGTAGRVLVTNGAGGIADGGVLLEELGGGAPAAHAASHATAGDDPITPASIGVATVPWAPTITTTNVSVTVITRVLGAFQIGSGPGSAVHCWGQTLCSNTSGGPIGAGVQLSVPLPVLTGSTPSAAIATTIDSNSSISVQSAPTVSVNALTIVLPAISASSSFMWTTFQADYLVG